MNINNNKIPVSLSHDEFKYDDNDFISKIAFGDKNDLSYVNNYLDSAEKATTNNFSGSFMRNDENEEERRNKNINKKEEEEEEVIRVIPMQFTDDTYNQYKQHSAASSSNKASKQTSLDAAGEQ